MSKNFSKGAILIGTMLTIGAGIFQVITNPPLPEKLEQKVPFSTQAPLDNWDHNENCEETSVIMAYHFFLNQSDLDPELVNDEINNLIKWEEANLGHHEDTGSFETAKMARYNFPLQTTILDGFTERDFKSVLNKHQVILLPVNAQYLEPSNYTDLHPTYHMIVIHSYDQGEFIVHDPGTRRGANNRYSFVQLQAAAADWEFGKTNPNLKKAIVVGASELLK